MKTGRNNGRLLREMGGDSDCLKEGEMVEEVGFGLVFWGVWGILRKIIVYGVIKKK